MGHVPAEHHKLLIRVLQEASEKPRSRVILVLPTGSAKSTYASVYFPPWYLKRHPNHGILACSHSAHLSESFGRKCRDMIDKFPVELGYSLSDRSQAAQEWETSAGSYYFAAGVTGRIAGRRAHLGLIDDPFGSREEADSAVYRDKVWDWWEWDFKRRLQPEASVILISTRWHEDDLVGRLLKRERGEWTLIHVPFSIETPAQEARDPLHRKIGDRLWPEYFTAQMEADLRKNARAWAALQQGEPSPDEGLMFTADMIVPYDSYDDIPKSLTMYCASDHAVRTREANDLSCFIPAGMDANGHLWIMPDAWWKRGHTGEQVSAMLDMAERREPMFWFAGRDHITGAIGPFLATQQAERHVYFALVELSDTSDKSKKAQAIHGMMSMGRVHFPAFAHWYSQAVAELLRFPAGEHDDFVDAIANLGRGLRYQRRATPAEPERKEPEPFSLKDINIKWLKAQQPQPVSAHGL